MTAGRFVQITLKVGEPIVSPTVYTFPSGL
jgi:hypothetical protein